MNIIRACFLFMSSIVALTAFADESPIYVDGKLHVPTVNADGKPGFFQDVVIEPAGDNLWRVSELYEAIPIREIDKVELIESSSTPVQVFLRISGSITGCSGFGRVSSIFNGNTFSVVAHYEVNKIPNEEIVCGQALTPYSEIFPIPVYGLDAGTYNYNVNGQFSGTFTLNSKNTL